MLVLGQLIMMLVAAIATCDQHADAQSTLVAEVKGALARALVWPESQMKHTKLRALTALISIMIESSQQVKNVFEHTALAAV